MHRMDNSKTISAYSEVMLLKHVEHTDELSFLSLPVLKCCGVIQGHILTLKLILNVK